MRETITTNFHVAEGTCVGLQRLEDTNSYTLHLGEGPLCPVTVFFKDLAQVERFGQAVLEVVARHRREPQATVPAQIALDNLMLGDERQRRFICPGVEEDGGRHVWVSHRGPSEFFVREAGAEVACPDHEGAAEPVVACMPHIGSPQADCPRCQNVTQMCKEDSGPDVDFRHGGLIRQVMGGEGE